MWRIDRLLIWNVCRMGTVGMKPNSETSPNLDLISRMGISATILPSASRMLTTVQ